MEIRYCDDVDSLARAKNYIDAIDFSGIMKKMVECGWQRQNALNLCQLYRNFLFLIFKYGDQYPDLSPSEDIDEFWHQHILDTQNYAKDCQNIFGKFIHHTPFQEQLGVDKVSRSNKNTSSFEVLQQLHINEFGYPIEKIYKRNIFYFNNNLMRNLKKIFLSEVIT